MLTSSTFDGLMMMKTKVDRGSELTVTVLMLMLLAKVGKACLVTLLIQYNSF